MKLLTINITWDNSEILKMFYINHAKLTNSDLNESLAFSAPALLAHQLSSLTRDAGVKTTEMITQSVNEKDYSYLYSNYERLPARIELFTRGRVITLKFKPKVSFFSMFVQERVYDLIINYSKYILNQDLSPYNDLVPKGLLFVCDCYHKIAIKKIENYMMGNVVTPEVREVMLAISLTLYDFWRSDFEVRYVK